MNVCKAFRDFNFFFKEVVELIVMSALVAATWITNYYWQAGFNFYGHDFSSKSPESDPLRMLETSRFRFQLYHQILNSKISVNSVCSIYLATVPALFQPPASMIWGSVAPHLTRSCAEPTRVECPDILSI